MYTKSPAQGQCSRLLTAVRRKKPLEDDSSPLARVLSLIDLTALGVGSTLGLGVYVLAGAEAKATAGPGVVVSFAIAAVASFFAGLCYAEFAARVPKAGSAYVYAYVAVGELVAFIIGWTLILEYAIGTASVSRGVGSYVDNLTGHVIANYLRARLPIGVANMAEYPDFFAFTIIVLLSVLLAVGVKESSLLNNILTALNLLTVITAVVAGATKANTALWTIPKSEIPANFTAIAGEGGFLPFGFKGVVAGAATCFFGYIGFDCIATTSEEAKNPRRNIPLSIILSLLTIFITYFSISTVLTMMRPYYEQDNEAPFPVAFDYFEMYTVKWIVTIGAIFALTTSLLGCMFPLPRVLYAMSRDGLLFEFLGTVNSRTLTPMNATIFAGLLSGVMALAFELSQLINMMSIGTLLAYSIVALCVMILRYSENPEPERCGVNDGDCGLLGALKLLVNSSGQKRPTKASGNMAMGLITLFIIGSIVTSLLMASTYVSMYDGSGKGSVLLGCLGGALLLILIFLSRLPISDPTDLSFAVPLIPWLPSISLFLNMYLMAELDLHTWIRFVVWMGIGGLLYFTYSIRYSVERNRNSPSATTAASVKAAEAEAEAAKAAEANVASGLPTATYL